MSRNPKESAGAEPARAADPFVHIIRDVDAPRRLVFEAWTSAEHLKHWFAPEGCKTAHCEVDFRKGGRIHYCITHPAVGECWCVGEYREIIVPEKIVHTIAFSDKHGNKLERGHAGMDPTFPKETVLTVTFTELHGKTRIVLHQTVSEDLAKRTGAYPSWLQMLDRLGAYASRN